MSYDKSITKSAVSALQEFCAKKQIGIPRYDFIPDESAFACQVEVLNFNAIGMGRSKRDAKHAAANNCIRMLRSQFPNDDCLCQAFDDASIEMVPPTDQIIQLRDYCVQNDIPLPIISFVQQGGTPDAPEFTCCCQIATIKRYATSDKKKDARQKAAFDMLRAISDTKDAGAVAEVNKMETTVEDIESERYLKFKTYRELIDSKTGEVPGVKLCDRHYYFTDFYKDLKDKAFQIIDTPQNYTGFREQAMALLEALKLKPTITEMVMNNGDVELYIELNCDIDAVFVGKNPMIFQKMVQYFNNMLK